MTDKIVRDELLRSHRYQSLSSDTAKLLFHHLLLASDCLSNAEATATAVSIIMCRTITEEAAASLLTEMADSDLIRIYIVAGKRYVHIPRSRQRIRYLYGKHPRPPENIEDNEIKELISKVGLQSGSSQSQDRSRARRSEVKRSKTNADAANAVAFAADGWQGITIQDQNGWREAYPAINLQRETAAALQWAIANPGNRKKNWRAFLVRWFARAQEQAPAHSNGITGSRKVAL